MQLSTSILRRATAYLTSTDQGMGNSNMTPLDKIPADFLASDLLVTTVKDFQMSAGTNALTCFQSHGDVLICYRWYPRNNLSKRCLTSQIELCAWENLATGSMI